MDDSHPSRSTSIAPNIPEIPGYLKIWPWNLKVKVHGWGQEQGGPVSNQFTSFSFPINQTTNSRGSAISKFDLEKPKVEIMTEVKGQVTYYTQYPTDDFSSSFHMNRTILSRHMTKRMFYPAETHPKLKRKFAKKCF